MTSPDTGDSTSPSDDVQTPQGRGKLAIPGAQARRHLGRKRTTCSIESGLQAVMDQQSKVLRDMYEDAENRQMEQNASFENLLRAHQEAEERRFQAMQMQQQANMSMPSQILSAAVNVMPPGQPHPPPQGPPQAPWISAAPPIRSAPTNTWSTPQPPSAQTQQHMTQQPMQPPMAEASGAAENGDLTLSAVLHQANANQHFYGLQLLQFLMRFNH